MSQAVLVVRPLFLETCQSPECPPSNGRQPSRKRKFDVKITIEITYQAYHQTTWLVAPAPSALRILLAPVHPAGEMLDFVIFASTVVVGLLVILVFCWFGDFNKVRDFICRMKSFPDKNEQEIYARTGWHVGAY